MCSIARVKWLRYGHSHADYPELRVEGRYARIKDWRNCRTRNQLTVPLTGRLDAATHYTWRVRFGEDARKKPRRKVYLNTCPKPRRSEDWLVEETPTEYPIVSIADWRVS